MGDTDRTFKQVSILMDNQLHQGLVAAVKEKIGGAGDFRAMDQKVYQFTVNVVKMKSQMLETERNYKEDLLHENASAEALLQVEIALILSADVAMKAKMFDVKLEQDNHASSKTSWLNWKRPMQT